jgi:adenine-specific DNA-methyltransferase
VRYYGGKEKLLEPIRSLLEEFNKERLEPIGDLFAGTGVVGKALRLSGHQVIANDILYFCYCLNVSNLSFVDDECFEQIGGFTNAIQILNNLPLRHGFISEHFSPAGSASRMYFSEVNAKRIDTIRINIEEWRRDNKITDLEKAALIGILLKAINRVSNVTGTYAAYLKDWDPRAMKDLRLEATDLIRTGPAGQVFNQDIFTLPSRSLPRIVYLDPPYNQRDYASNYHLLELISVGWFEQGVVPSGVTGMTTDRSKKSTFSSKRTVVESFGALFEIQDFETVVLSYSNEGLISIKDLVDLMSHFGNVRRTEIDHKRFRSINQDGSRSKTIESLIVLERGNRG